LLVCCDKPGASDPRRGESASDGPHRRNRARERTPDAAISPGTPLETALAIPATEARTKALAEVAWNAIETDPEAAHLAFQQLPPEHPEKIRLIQHYAMRVAERDPEEAMDWASTLETEQEVATAKSHIALALAETDPRRAANLLSESGIAGRDFDVALVQVIQRWAAKSPPDAAAWVATFPPSAAREAGIKFIAEQWLAGDASAAFRWYDELDGTALRQEAARAMEGVILQQPKETRDAWLQHANDKIRRELDQQREQSIREIGDNIRTSAK
jgi:hypothetical protein